MAGLYVSLIALVLLLLKPVTCELQLGDPSAEAANYDGTDIARPYLVDNSTGTPVYTYLDIEDYHPPSNRSKRAAISLAHRLWPKGIILYRFDSSLTDEDKEVTLDAMRHWEEKTCLRFHPGSGRQGLLFDRAGGCASYVGRVTGIIIAILGGQRVSVGGCGFSATVHEIGHAVGFWHEQSRPDRDKYITIHNNNIHPGVEINFQIETDVDSLGVTYDFNSIMQYSARHFSRNGNVTISTKEKDIPLGLATELSPLDIRQTNLLYKTQCSLRSSSESVSRLPPKNIATPAPITLPPGRCNRVLRGTSGRFSPPDNPYRSNTDCTWLIEIPIGHYIDLTIHDVEIDGPCNTNNRIGISYYGDSYLTRMVCGYRSTSTIRLTRGSGHVNVTFHTNERVNSQRRRGFSRVTYTARDINECETYRARCDHDCENLIGSFKCTCRSGWYLSGTRRCRDHNECGDNNGGCSHTCVNMAGTHRCECPTGYTLLPNKRDCIREGSPCLRNNGGCDHRCTNTPNGARCSCRDGYQLSNGRRCTDINECSNRTLCSNDNQRCVNMPGTYTCVCRNGYHRINGTCEDIDECASGIHNCKSNERCINRPGRFVCRCADGYRSVNRTCEDINECDESSACDQLCTNTIGSYYCGCNEGYNLMDDGKSCEDIDECSGRNSNRRCPSDKFCVNTPGTFACECKEGYKQLDNGTCEDINECETDVCQQRCTNRIGSFRCKCFRGYRLMEDRRSCEDIDECSVDNGGCDETCVNTNGSYSCQCDSGLQLLSDKKSCGLSSEDCIPGSHGCRTACDERNNSCCLPGLELNRNGMLCRDIDECANGVDKCQQICVNTIGSFHCDCHTGYRLRTNQRNCREIDECSNRNHNCSHTCVNTPGAYRCECPEGFELDTDSSTCKDINECERSGCGGYNCTNTIGSFQCTCPLGYHNKSLDLNGTMFTCEDINECEEGDHECTHNCINTMGSYTCSCRPGYYLSGNNQQYCRDINECSTNNGGCDHTCRNTRGSFRCSCNTSYILTADQKSCVTSCDSTTIMHETTGHIGTYGFPNSSYAPNSNCTWLIDLPEQYKSVELRVDGLSLETSDNCTKDQLTVLNGKDEKSLPMGSYCGNKLPAIMQSSTRVVVVKFTSDDRVNRKGFSLQYRGLTNRVEGMYGCNLTIRENTTFALPTFPSNYTSPIDCVYSLTGPRRDYKVKVNFLYLDIQEANCSTDRIEVYTGRILAHNNKLGDICIGGTQEIEFSNSIGRHMRIRYIGNTLNRYQGFHASVTFVL